MSFEMNNQIEITQIEIPNYNNQNICVSSPIIEITEIGFPGLPGKDASNGGWAFYKDSQYTNSNKNLIPNGIRTPLVNDGLHPLSSSIYKPINTAWWNTQNNIFIADKLGDVYLIRLNITMSSPVNNRTVTIDFDIGTTNPPISQDFFISRGADVSHKMSFNLLIGTGNGLINNGGTINITCNSDLYIWDISYLIQKTFENVN